MTQRRKVQSPRPKLLEFELEPLQFTIKFPDPQNVIGTRNLKLFADQLQDLQLTVTPLVQKRENGEVVEVMELEAIPAATPACRRTRARRRARPRAARRRGSRARGPPSPRPSRRG